MSTSETWRLNLGARPVGPSTVEFRVWAPRAKTVAVRLIGQDRNPLPMKQRELGYFEATVSDVGPGTRYRYVLDDQKERPDPASRFQPDGVHGASVVVDPDAFRWTDETWSGLPLAHLIMYELHTGTFTPEGTFEAIIPYLDYLQNQVGVTAIELMPVAQFPGVRNWGYDGVYPFAPQVSYGGPQGLKTLVDACHARGLAVILDVVYNHLGPEGNYLGDFGPYFTDQYRTPWGQAINYDGPDSDEVRHYVISNALYWVTEYHMDALRLDAIHGIYDFSARHLLRELTEAVHAEADRLGRRILVIAESNLNDVRVIAPPSEGGYGLDAQWNDDFHHALHTILTGERAGYYEDFGHLEQLATALREGFIYSGQRSPYRRRRHGNSARTCSPSQFIVFAQNHDQVGNRAEGDRLSTLVPYEALKVAAASVLLAPNIPLLFMGEEYGETAPFQYFTDHGDQALVEAVRKGRQAEFASFEWKDEVPDPQALATFERSRVRPGSQSDDRQAAILRWYHHVIGLRKSMPALAAFQPDKHGLRVWADEAQLILVVHRWIANGQAALLLLGFNRDSASVR
ncbi:MAG TPA: malto-oligosyltrehalose trehalohydrolase, partial [Nitrospiraceae bacterium]|nr:malto-oligosyltrehalose trehalohydrolase [Nitrospiraceae bacterium]